MEWIMKRLLPVAFPMLFALACIAATPAAGQKTAVADDTPAATLMTPSPTVEIIDTTAVVETPAEGMINVWVFFTMAADENMAPVPVARTVPETDNQEALVHSTLKELLKGPTDAEIAQGFTSWFSPATAGAVTDVVWDGEFFTVVFQGLKTLIPNASTSAGSQILLSQLNSTVFQFDFVESVNYTLEGNCDDFWQWLQSDCHIVTRAEWEAG
jgi:spore germination protein GerM